MNRFVTALATAALLVCSAQAQTNPGVMNLLYFGDKVYMLNTATGVSTPIRNNTEMGAMLSPDGRQIAYATWGKQLVISNNDGSNERAVPNVYMNVDFANSFSWTTQGIFWIHYNRDTQVDSFFCYNPSTGTLKKYAPFRSKPNSTSFGGCWASTDGTRMFTWLDMDMPSTDGQDPTDTKPYIYFNNGNFDTPVIKYKSFWGHGNAMLPNGQYLLCVRWDYGAADPQQGKNHPWLATVNMSDMTEGPKWVFPAYGDKNIVPIVNTSDWIAVQLGDEGTSPNKFYLWKFATDAGWTEVFNRATRNRLQCGWMGSLPSPVAWAITEASLSLTDSVKTGAFHVTGWSATANPTVSSNKTWTGTPAITKSGTTVTITYTLPAGTLPTSKDTATITVRDANGATQSSRIFYAPRLTTAEKLTITTNVTATSVTLSWTGTVTGYTYKVREKTGTTWGSYVTATGSYADTDPVNGTNTYRVYAINGTDTSYVETQATYSAPPSITISSPTAGATFAPGATVPVVWDVVNVASVEIQISVDDGDTWIKKNPGSSINFGGPGWGNYSITLPTTPGPVLIMVNQYNSDGLNDQVAVTISSTGTLVRAAQGSVSRTVPSVWYNLHGQRVAGQAPQNSAYIGVTGTRGTLRATVR